VTAIPLGRAAAAAVMTLIATATVVSLTRSDAPAQVAAQASDADLPAVAAVAPDVAAAAPLLSDDSSWADLYDRADLSGDLWDDLLEQSAAAAATTEKSSQGSRSDDSTAMPDTETTAPVAVAPSPVETTPAPAKTTPAPAPAPAPSPTPTKSSSGLEKLLTGLFGGK